MRRTKIVATLGPASESRDAVRELASAGVNVFRLNLSHGTPAELERRTKTVQAVAEETGLFLGVMYDLRGPEIRLGEFPGGQVDVPTGGTFRLTPRPGVGAADAASISYPGLAADVRVGDMVLLDDGNLIFRVVRCEGDDVVCDVLAGGILSDHKKCLVPGVRVGLPPLQLDDERDLDSGLQLGIDFVAASFVQTADDVLTVRRFLEQHTPAATEPPEIIAKIETRQGVDNLASIIEVSDGVMVARGDLGLEVPTEEIPFIQKQIIQKVRAAGKPVITATQMLESMVQHPRPTRAEATDVANAILDGTDAVMLSAESASGRYPLEAVKMMARIAERADAQPRPQPVTINHASNVTGAVGRASVSAAEALSAAAIITPTASGRTPRLVGSLRPQTQILAMTYDERVARRLSVVWGVQADVVQPAASTDEMVEMAVERALSRGLIAHGDVVVITAGFPVGVSGTTNTIKVHTVAAIMARGAGMGHRAASGRAVVVGSKAQPLPQVTEEDVLFAAAITPELVPLARRACALVVEEAGLSSGSAVIALNLDKPAILGATNVTRLVRGGDVVTVDGIHGILYRGKVIQI